MRFDRIHIPAFGPFHEWELDFPTASADFHLIYGRNEAGKSSLLRAINGLLFGIPVQTTDNFRHANNKDLRIGAVISNRSGKRLAFLRRKGNKSTLLDPAGQALADDALMTFLGPIDQGYFSTMFGLGINELHSGAQELLSGKGELGSALFSASFGGTPVQQALARLTEESELLYKGRATKSVTIRPTIKRYKDLQTEIRNALVNPEKGKRIDQDLDQVTEELEGIQQRERALHQKVDWLQRVSDALPMVARLREQQRILDALPSLPNVADDFVARSREAVAAVSRLQAELDRYDAEIEKWKRQLAAIDIPEALLSRAGQIDQLTQDWGSLNAIENELAGRQLELAELELKLQQARVEAGAGSSDPEALRIDALTRRKFEEASEALSSVTDQQKQVLVERNRLECNLQEVARRLQELGDDDLPDLDEIVDRADDAQKALRGLDKERQRLESLQQALHRAAKQLGIASEVPDEWIRLPIPGRATLQRFAQEFQGLHGEVSKLEYAIEAEQQEIAAFELELERLQRRGVLPTRDDLSQARGTRDRGWKLVVEDWLGDGASQELVPGVPLDVAFADAMQRADLIADQLLEEAQIVEQVEERKSQIEKSARAINELQQKLAGQQAILREKQTEWEQLWTGLGIQPKSPDEMDEWREQWMVLQRDCVTFQELSSEVQRKEVLVEETTAELGASLRESPTAGLLSLVALLKKRLKDRQRLAGQREELEQQQRSLQQKVREQQTVLEGLQSALKTANADWERVCDEWGLSGPVSPSAGQELLRARKTLLEVHDRHQHVRAEMAQKRADRERLLQSATELGVELGIPEQSPPEIVRLLRASLEQTRADQSRADAFTRERNDAEREHARAKENLAAAREQLQGLLRAARLDSPEELESLWADLQRRDEALREIARQRDNLIGLARGESVDEFIHKVDSEDREDLEERIGEWNAQKESLSGETKRVQQRQIELSNEQRILESEQSRAAELAQEVESLGARLHQDTVHFTKLRLAIDLLQSQVEQFRKDNQGPLLETSSRLFAEITRGAFRGLRADYGEDDTPMLVGIRNDGESVTVAGLSDGTRDQLYLALRLAALEHYQERNEPMPLIMDDLLITFDDDRARSILCVLQRLAEKTQVFLFTHHDHLLDLARESLPREGYRVHRMQD